jgi:hypothetical protein
MFLIKKFWVRHKYNDNVSGRQEPGHIMSRKCTALLILIGIIQFGITVQTAQVD